jgi:hypothetical protein
VLLLLLLLLLLAGNEPLAPGAVVSGTGTAAEAKAAAGAVCSQLVLLGGQLSMQSLLGPRTAAVKNVAMNRTLAAGASVKKVRAAECTRSLLHVSCGYSRCFEAQHVSKQLLAVLLLCVCYPVGGSQASAGTLCCVVIGS